VHVWAINPCHCFAVNWVTSLLGTVFMLAWSELTVGKMRLLIQIMVFPASAIGSGADESVFRVIFSGNYWMARRKRLRQPQK
jgi:hypothetical protein